MTTHDTRESWLNAALPALGDIIKKAGGKAYPTPLVSVGFPYRARSKKGGKAIGQCWTVPGDKGSHIFLHPCLDAPVQLLDVLLHELIHAATPGAGHRGDFAKVATACGLEGPMTSTEAGPELREGLREIAKGLGKFPHRPKKQATRMLKWECPGCGQIIRAATQDLECQCVACSEESDEPVLFAMADA